jgi:hypothetical protein
MAIAGTVVDIDNSGKSLYLTLLLTFSGSYATGGDTLDLTSSGVGAIGKSALGRVFQAGKAPLYGYVAGSGGYSFGFIPGSGSPPNLANGKVKISTTAATELAAGAYPAGITGDANIYATLAFDLNL